MPKMPYVFSITSSKQENRICCIFHVISVIQCPVSQNEILEWIYYGSPASFRHYLFVADEGITLGTLQDYGMWHARKLRNPENELGYRILSNFHSGREGALQPSVEKREFLSVFGFQNCFSLKFGLEFSQSADFLPHKNRTKTTNNCPITNEKRLSFAVYIRSLFPFPPKTVTLPFCSFSVV